MSVPIILGPLSELQRRSFAFYPAIVGIEHNEWKLRRASWTEVQVINTKTGTELWVPRRILGEISSVEAPVVIVGLIKELEFKEGALVPHRRRVLEMPRAVNGSIAVTRNPLAGTRPAPVIAIRAEHHDLWHSRKVLRGSIAAGIIACVAGGFLVRDAQLGSRTSWVLHALRPLHLNPRDDYRSVVRKLGEPSSDEWRRTPQGTEYRRLWYPGHGVAVILSGSTHDSATFAGATTWHGEVVQSANSSLLQEIGRETATQ